MVWRQQRRWENAPGAFFCTESSVFLQNPLCSLCSSMHYAESSAVGAIGRQISRHPSIMKSLAATAAILGEDNSHRAAAANSGMRRRFERNDRFHFFQTALMV